MLARFFSSRAVRIFLRDKTAVVGLVIFTIIVLLAVLAPWIAPHDAVEQNLRHRFLPPGEEGYLLGTDRFGRDLLSRIIWGARISLTAGLASVVLAIAIGVPLGILGGFFGGAVDRFVTRLTDVLMAFPDLVLALVIVTLLGAGLDKVVLAIAFTLTPRFIRLARGPTLALREQDFVQAARALGAGYTRQMAKYIFPNIVGQILAISALFTGVAIRTEANLSFIGLGIQPPTPTWGGMLRDGLGVMGTAPWISLYPGIAIFVAILALNMIGDGFRDAIDPKTGRG